MIVFDFIDATRDFIVVDSQVLINDFVNIVLTHVRAVIQPA